MEYRFEGTDRFPDIMFTDDKIQDAKGNECYYSDIEKIEVVGRAGIERMRNTKYEASTCGIVSVRNKLNKNLYFSFQGKDIDAVEQVVSEVAEMVSVRKLDETRVQTEKRELKTIELEKSLNTADGMYNYCRHMGCSNGMPPTWGHENFGIIESSLMPDEKVIFTFVGRYELKDSYAFAITNKRIIYALKRFLGKFVKSVDLGKLNDVTLVSTFMADTIEFDFLKEHFDVYMPQNSAKVVYNNIHKALSEYRTQAISTNQPQIISGTKSSAEQIREYKGLLDDGIITQAEFDAKKKELLNL